MYRWAAERGVVCVSVCVCLERRGLPICLFAFQRLCVCDNVWRFGVCVRWRLGGCEAVWLLEVVIRLIICFFQISKYSLI